jgi:hypothetical protein
VVALRGKSAIAFSRGHVEESGALLRRSLELALEHDLPDEAGTAYVILSDSEFRRDRYAPALEYLSACLALARKQGIRTYEWGTLAEMTYPLWMFGRWDEALALIEEPTEEHTRSGGVMLSLLTALVEIHLARGRTDEARRIFSLFSHLESSTDVQDRSCYLAARAVLRHADGKLRDALADAAAAMKAGETLGYAQQAAKQAVATGLEAALALGDEARARELIAFLQEAPPGRRAPFFEAQAQRFRARLDGDLAGFDAAERIFRDFELRFWLAVTRLEHAEALAAAGRADEAEPLRAEALATFDELDATPWLERAERARAPGSIVVPL